MSSNIFLKQFYCYLLITSFLHISVAFAFVEFLSTFSDTIKYYSISHLTEQCDKRWIPRNIIGLEEDLYKHVFGQDLAIDVILLALRSHIEKYHRKKPLVLNFHGWPGGGKGYVADFILKHWFKKGEKSKFMKRYLAKLHFPLKSMFPDYQKRLQRELEETISLCPRSVFVFDEVDKYPPQVLDGIKSYLDYNIDVNGYDFREAIFIFITNNGDKQITNIALQKWKAGFPRADLQLRDFEHILKTTSFNDEGGFYQSDIIRHHLIDHVVPFLPLEREHVAACVQAEILIQGGSPSLIRDSVSNILDEITFAPDDLEVYAVNGCKSISEKVAYILQKEKRKNRQRHTEF